MNKNGYVQDFSSIKDCDSEEKYALVTHYIQLSGDPEAENYKVLLGKSGVNIEMLPNK